MLAISRYGARTPRELQRFADDRVLDLVHGSHALELRVLDDQLVDERAMERDVDVLVDRGRDDEAAVLAVVRRQVGAAAAEGNAQRAPRDDHGATRPARSDGSARPFVELLDDAQAPRARRPGPPSTGRPVSMADTTSANSALPGAILAGIFPARRLGWAHLGQHPVERQPLDAVAAAEAVDLQLGVASVDLEREQCSSTPCSSPAATRSARRPSAAARSRCPRRPSSRSSARPVPATCTKSPANQRARSIRWTP